MTLPANTLPKPAHVKAQTKQILLYRKTAGSALGISRRRTHCFSREMDVGSPVGDNANCNCRAYSKSIQGLDPAACRSGRPAWKREQSMRDKYPLPGWERSGRRQATPSPSTEKRVGYSPALVGSRPLVQNTINMHGVAQAGKAPNREIPDVRPAGGHGRRGPQNFHRGVCSGVELRQPLLRSAGVQPRCTPHDGNFRYRRPCPPAGRTLGISRLGLSRPAPRRAC